MAAPFSVYDVTPFSVGQLTLFSADAAALGTLLLFLGCWMRPEGVIKRRVRQTLWIFSSLSYFLMILFLSLLSEQLTHQVQRKPFGLLHQNPIALCIQLDLLGCLCANTQNLYPMKLKPRENAVPTKAATEGHRLGFSPEKG